MFKPNFRLSRVVSALALLALAGHALAADPVYIFKSYTPGIKGNYVLVTDPLALSFGQVVAGEVSNPPNVVTLHNIGTSPISFSAVAASAEFTQTNTCIFLAADATCSAAVSFAPTQTGAQTGSLTLTYDNGRILSVPLSGTGVGSLPIATFSTNAVAFGAVPLGTTATLGVQLENTGQQSLAVSGVTTAGADFAASHGCTTLEPTETCFANVTFTPAVADAVSGTLEFTTNAPGSPHDIALSGSGAAPVIGFAPAAPLTFGSTAVGATSATQTVTVSNASAVATLDISSIAADAPFSASATTCTTTLAPGANCTVDVAYAPVAVGATQTGVLRVTGSLSGSGLTYQLTGGQAAYALTGTAVAAVPVISFTELPATGDFGNVALGTPSSKVVTLTNTGYGALHLTSTALSGADAADFAKSDSTCESRTLARDESCSITVTVTPTVPAAESATLTFGNSDGATGNTVTFSVTGQGAIITLLDANANVLSSVDFPETSVGSNSTAVPVTLTNTGNATLTFGGSVIVAAAPFSQTNNCGTAGASAVSGSTIVAGASCTVFVTFSPTAAQPYSANLSITSNAIGYAPLALTGSASMAGVVQIAAGAGHTVVLKSDGTVWTTGYNNYGQLGNNATGTNRATFGPVQGITGAATAIAAGYSHTVVLAGGTVQTTGRNAHGQLGSNATGTHRATFGPVQGIAGAATAIAAAGDYTVVIAGGTVQTTGYNGYGQLGSNATGTHRALFGPVQGITGTATAIAAGQDHTVVIAGGTVQTTGYNSYGQLGNNNTTPRSTFGPVQGITGTVTAIAAGNEHTVVIAGGTVQTTGWNGYGLLGNNTTTSRSTFGPVQGITGTVTAIAAGANHTVVIAGGTVQATGSNGYSQLGNGTTANRSTFGPVQGVTGTATAISAGAYHTGVIAGGTVQTTGYNSYGQLGNTAIAIGTPTSTFGAVTPF